VSQQLDSFVLNNKLSLFETLKLGLKKILDEEFKKIGDLYYE